MSSGWTATFNSKRKMAAFTKKLASEFVLPLSRRYLMQVPVREPNLIINHFHTGRKLSSCQQIFKHRTDAHLEQPKNSQIFPFKVRKVDGMCLHRSLLMSTPRRNYSSETNASADEEEEDKLYKWIELKVKGHDTAVLNSYQTFVMSAAKELDVKAETLKEQTRDIYRLTLLKSRNIFKKHRVQYEVRTYFRLIKLRHLTGTTADVFLEYIQRNLPEGLAMQVKKCSLERLPEHLTKPPEDLDLPSQTAQDETGGSGSNPLDSKDSPDSLSSPDSESSSGSSSSSDSESSSDSDSDSEGDDAKS